MIHYDMQLQDAAKIRALVDFILMWYDEAGVRIGEADLQIRNDSEIAKPFFAPKEGNPLEADVITLKLDSCDDYATGISQLAHELTHCLIYRLNPNWKQLLAFWAEETICEAMQLVMLRELARRWRECTISTEMPYYMNYLRGCIVGQFDIPGTWRLTKCHGMREFLQIEDTATETRKDRWEEAKILSLTITAPQVVPPLLRYRDYVFEGASIFDAVRFRADHPDNLAVDYLCTLQEKALLNTFNRRT